jgi:hypothetical protein
MPSCFPPVNSNVRCQHKRMSLLLITVTLGLSLLIAVSSPCLVLWLKKHYTVEMVSSARRCRVLSIFVAVVAILKALGISLAHHGSNIAIVILAIICVGALVYFSFKLKPKFLGIPVGFLSGIGWFFTLIFLLVGLVTDDISPRTKEIGENMYCRRSLYGFVTSDSGTTLEVFQRYLFIDRLITSQMYSDIYREDPKPKPNELEVINRCQAAFKDV